MQNLLFLAQKQPVSSASATHWLPVYCTNYKTHGSKQKEKPHKDISLRGLKTVSYVY